MKLQKFYFLTLLSSLLLFCFISTTTVYASDSTTITQIYGIVPTVVVGDTVSGANYCYSGTTNVTVISVNWTNLQGDIYPGYTEFQQGVTYYCDIEFKANDGYTFPSDIQQLSCTINDEAATISNIKNSNKAYVRIGFTAIKPGYVYMGGIGLEDGYYLRASSHTPTTAKPNDNYAYYNDGVLTLHNYNFEGLGYVVPLLEGEATGAIYTEYPLQIILEGTNTITVKDYGQKGVCLWNNKYNDFTITGEPDSSLTLNTSYRDIVSYGKLNITNSTLNINTGDYGIDCMGGCNISDSNLSFSGDGFATTISYAFVIKNSNLKVNTSSGINTSFYDTFAISDSTIDINSTGFGLYNNNPTTITNSDISIVSDDSRGIYANESITFTDSTVSIDSWSQCIYMNADCPISINNCDMELKSVLGATLYPDKMTIFGKGQTITASTSIDGTLVPYVYDDNSQYKRLIITPHTHDYTEATCTSPKICKICDASTGTVLPHNYTDIVTKSTMSSCGSITTMCPTCNTTFSIATISQIGSITLSKTSYTYNGAAQKPSVVVKDDSGVTIPSTNYTVTYSSGCKNVGTYTVTVNMKGNYTGSKTLTYKITPIDISKNTSTAKDFTATIKQSSFAYTGKYIKPIVTVKGTVSNKSITLSKENDYSIKYSNYKNPGTAKITVTGKGNYTGEIYLTFTIRPVNLSKFSATIKQSTFTYTGKYIKPVVTVKGTVNGNATTLRNQKDYKITYINYKNPGKATITITGKGIYTGTKTITFYIKPTQVKNVKYKGRSTTYVNFKWDACTGATGYEIYRATSKTGKYTKVATISSTSYKNTKLKSKTKYYYKIRAYKVVGNTKLYGAYSSIYTISTK